MYVTHCNCKSPWDRPVVNHYSWQTDRQKYVTKHNHSHNQWTIDENGPKNYLLRTPFDDKKQYIRIILGLISQEVIDKYNLQDTIENGRYIYNTKTIMGLYNTGHWQTKKSKLLNPCGYPHAAPHQECEGMQHLPSHSACSWEMEA